MSIELSPILRVRAVSEAAFGTDETGSLGGFTDVPFRTDSVTWTTDREMLDPMTGKQRMDAADFKIPGWRRGTLTMTHNLAPSGIASGDAVTPLQTALGLLLKIGMGGESLNDGNAVNTAASASEYTVTGTSETGVAEGRAHSVTGAIEARVPYRTVPTHVRTEFSETPSPADVLFGSATYHLTSNPAESAQFIVEGAENDDGWLFMGCQLDSVSIDTTIGQIPTIAMSWKCASYLMASETVGTIGAATAATITLYSPIIAEGDFIVRRTTTGVVLPASTCMASITINFGLSYAEVPCPSGVSGIKQYRRIRSVPVASLSYQTFYEDETAWADRDAKEPRAITWQMGTTAGDIVMLEWPNLQITDVQRVDGAGLASQAISCEAHEDAESLGTLTDLRASAFRIHFL